MRRIAVTILAAFGLIAALAIATYTLPPVFIADEPVAADLKPLVEDARRSIIGQSRVFPRPLHSQLIGARCFSDDRVALYFEEWVPPYLGNRYAVAVGTPAVGLGQYVWEGGYHLDDIGPGSDIDTDVVGTLGDEVPCSG